MEVHFCDLCNESVPQRDLDLGRAFLRKGRVVCASCDLAMGSHEAGEFAAPLAMGPSAGVAVIGPPVAPAPPIAAAPHRATAVPAASVGGGLALTLAALGILLTACAAVLLFERLDEAGRAAAGEQARLRVELSEGLGVLRGEIGSGASERALDLERFEVALAELAEREERREQGASEALSRVAADLQELAAEVGANAGVSEELARHAREIESLAGVIAETRGDVGVVAEKVLELAQRPAAPAGPSTPAASAAAAEAPPNALGPVWEALLPQLKSTSSGERWSAVQALGETHDPEVVPHLLPMLKDADIFVRMASARVLGDLGVMGAVPHLIDALEDEEPSVREQAHVSLRELTGKDFKFDPSANEADRAKKVKAWREWWKREGEPAAAG